MKWLSKLFKGSGTSRLGGERPQFLGEESMVWSAPVRSVVIFVPCLRLWIISFPSTLC